MSTFTQGLTITAVGMGLVFLALGILLLAMVLLQKIFPPASAEPVEAGESAAVVEAPAHDRSAEKIAAIGAALARAQAEERRSVALADFDKLSPRGSSGWAAAGRTRTLNQPQSREKKR